jgi:hypothetical protein
MTQPEEGAELFNTEFCFLILRQQRIHIELGCIPKYQKILELAFINIQGKVIIIESTFY